MFAVRFGLLEKRPADAVEGFENLRITWRGNLHDADNLGTGSGISTAVCDMAEVLEYIGRGERRVKK